MYDPHSREPRGFAFVTMDGLEAAEAAIAGMNGVDLLGRVLSVQKVSHPTPLVASKAASLIFVLLAGTPWTSAHSHSRSLLWTS